MLQELFELSAKIALVTGSSRGIGLVMARGLAEAGATVIINGRDPDRLELAQQELAGLPGRALGYRFDVTDKNQLTESIALIEKEVGALDILVNNAGVQRRGALDQIEEEQWREVLDVNLTGPFLAAQAVVKGMISRQSGKIINICSLMSEVGRPTTGPYAASKGGLKMLTRTMAIEWAKHNIQTNGIGPGYFITEMTQPLAQDPQFDSWLRSRTPAGRWGDPRELLGPLVFLASDASSFVNGQILYVDGGVLASL